uniref:Uncharacterized protein n=1 Tax=Cacopsylla melanoneura TaxID=428564 RepID=A0A8D8ZQU7_9HEMI
MRDGLPFLLFLPWNIPHFLQFKALRQLFSRPSESIWFNLLSVTSSFSSNFAPPIIRDVKGSFICCLKKIVQCACSLHLTAYKETVMGLFAVTSTACIFLIAPKFHVVLAAVQLNSKQAYILRNQDINNILVLYSLVWDATCADSLAA